jgi:hypothetical protein
MKRSRERENELGLVLALYRDRCLEIQRSVPAPAARATPYAAVRDAAIDRIFTAMRKPARESAR